MSMKQRMQGSNPASDPAEKLYREERAYRADRLVEKWSRVPELGKGLKNMSEQTARNTAILLENQARAMSRMTEAQLSSNFYGFTPENMLRLVRLSYPNSIRGKIFTEFAMETARDSIKYIRPVYTQSQKDQFDGASSNTMDNRTFGDLNLDGTNGFGTPDYRKAMYETTEDRYPTELANGSAVQGVDANVKYVTVTYTSGAFGTNGAAYIDGYSAFFLQNEKQPLAVQTRDGSWYYGQPVEHSDGNLYKVSAVSKSNAYTWVFTIQVSADDGATWADVSGAVTGFLTYGRFNSENDLSGQYLGEVELVMTDYQFRPRPLALGVTWTKLTELVLDTSFGVSAEEMLLDAAGQEIKKALDFRAIRYAYGAQKQFASDNVVTFNAEAGASTDDSYLQTAQLINQSVERIGDIMYNDLNRGGVSRIVGGPAAVTYLRLNAGFTTKGAQPRIGGYQVGELNGIPVFKVPSSVVPDNELLTVWKNDHEESDVSVAFGTLLPFYSTGSIVRKNFYTEAGVARFEDQQVLQPKYLGRITIDGIREIN